MSRASRSRPGQGYMLQIPAQQAQLVIRELGNLQSILTSLTRQVDVIEDRANELPTRILSSIEPVKSKVFDVETRIANALNVANGWLAPTF